MAQSRSIIDNPHHGDARRGLQQRLERAEMGDAEYDRMVAQTDNRGFTIFGIVFIIGFAIVAFAVTLLGY